jgi:hypothetical protein
MLHSNTMFRFKPLSVSADYGFLQWCRVTWYIGASGSGKLVASTLFHGVGGRKHISTTQCIFTMRKSVTGIGPNLQGNLLPPTFYFAAGGRNDTLQKTVIRDPSFSQQHLLFFTVLTKVQTEYHAQQLQPQPTPARRRVSLPDPLVLSTRRLTVERSQL